MALTACNDDIFIDPVETHVSNEYIAWTGGESRMSYAGDGISEIRFSVARLVNGRKIGLTDGEPELTDLPNGFKLFKNELIEFNYGLNRETKTITVNVAHSFYSDSVQFNATVISKYGNVKAYAYILPAPPFDIGAITYNLDSWSSELDNCRYKSLIAANNGSDEVSLTIIRQGEIIAPRECRFDPFDGVLCSAVLSSLAPGATFQIPYYEADMWQPVMSDDKAIYSTIYRPVASSPLVAERDYNVMVKPHTSVQVDVYITYDILGFDYSIPATNKAAGIELNLNGILRLRTPVALNLHFDENQSNQPEP